MKKACCLPLVFSDIGKGHKLRTQEKYIRRREKRITRNCKKTEYQNQQITREKKQV